MKFLKKFYWAFILAFLYIPIFVMITFSFNESKSRTVFTGFTTQWYFELFNNDLVIEALFTSLFVAIVSAVVATALGTLAAVGINSMTKMQRAVVINITYMPVVNPEIVTAISMLLLFGILKDLFGLEYGIVTLLISHITFCVPYVVLSVLPKIRQMDMRVYEAALDLGCNPNKAFFKVVIPEIMPGVVTGFLMALTYSMDDFVVSYFNGGHAQTLPVVIYSMTRRKVSPDIYALSTIIFAVILTILLIVNISDVLKEKKLQKQK